MEESKRIRHGEEPGCFMPDMPCGDCGCKPGEYHRERCDNEQCPRCGGQFISCGCTDEQTPSKYYASAEAIGDTEEHRLVESQTKEHVIDILKRAGIPRGAGLAKYSISKRLVYRGLFIDCKQYERQLKCMVDYLGM